MAVDRGLPSVPRGMERELTSYLQSLDAYVRRLSGAVRGSDGSRALRASEASRVAPSAVSIGANSISATMLRDGAVTEKKIADAAVTATKLAQSAVTEKALAAGAVTESTLAMHAVTAGKIAPGVLLHCVAGRAEDGCTVVVPGTWLEAPCIVLTGIVHTGTAFIVGEEVTMRIGAHAIRQEGDVWMFDACGTFEFVAIGKMGDA